MTYGEMMVFRLQTIFDFELENAAEDEVAP